MRMFYDFIAEKSRKKKGFGKAFDVSHAELKCYQSRFPLTLIPICTSESESMHVMSHFDLLSCKFPLPGER